MLAGLFWGPTYVTLISYFQKTAQQKSMGRMIGIQGSFFSAATSLGYGLLALTAGAFTPSFPFTLVPVGIVFLLGGLTFYFASRRVAGLGKKAPEPGSPDPN